MEQEAGEAQPDAATVVGQEKVPPPHGSREQTEKPMRSDLDELMDRARDQRDEWRLHDTLSALDEPRTRDLSDVIRCADQHIDFAARNGKHHVTVWIEEFREIRDALLRLAEKAGEDL